MPLPPPLYVGDIDILHKSDVPLSVTEEKLMTEGCDRRGVELAGSHRSLAAHVSESVFVLGLYKCALHTNRLIKGKRGVGLARWQVKRRGETC